MRVTILGAGTTIPAARYSPSGIYLQVAGERLLLDAGPGTLQRLHAIGVRYLDLDRVFLTHFHLDHCLDLATLLFAMRIPRPDPDDRRPPPRPARPERRGGRQLQSAGRGGGPVPARKRPLTVYGPRGLKPLYRRLNTAFHGWLTPRSYRLTIGELSETTLRFGGYTVRARRMRHATAALGYRIDAHGKSLAYSGDTDVCRAVVELGRGADLLILECSHPDERKVTGHLTPSECGRIAAEAGCRHLVLTHFYPVFRGYDIRRRVQQYFRGRLSLAKDFFSSRL